MDPTSTEFDRTLRRFALVTLLVLLLPGLALAQQGEPAGDATPAATEVAPPPVPEEHRSPRATMTTFLESFDPEKQAPGVEPLDVAAACLDLSGFRTTVREPLGREYSRQLKEILDRVELIDLAALSDQPDAEPWRLAIGDGAGEVVLAPNAAGEWLFTEATVASIPELFRAVEDREVVEGVLEATTLTPALWLRSKVPSSWRQVAFVLEVWQWVGLAVLLLLGLLLDRAVTWVLKRVVQGYLARRTESVAPSILRRAFRPFGLLAAALLCWLGVFWLGLPPTILEALVTGIEFLAAAAFVWAAYRVVDVISAVLTVRAERSENKFDDLLVPLVRTSLKVFIAAFGFVFMAEVVNLPISSVIAGLGIGGLAIGLGAQDAVKNFFGSLMIITDRPFAVGDWVKIGGVEGSVAELGFRSTRIRTFYDSIVTVPNANLIDANVDNLGVRRHRRWSTKVGITYDTPPDAIEAFCEGIRELIRRHPYTGKKTFQVYLNQFGPSSLDILLYVFFETPDWATELRERHRLAVDILRLGHELGVDFAFPTQTIHLHQDAEGRDHPDVVGYDEVMRDARDKGRERAQALVDGALGDRKPPPAATTGAGEADG